MWQVTNERHDASPLLGFLPLFASMAKDIETLLGVDIDLEFMVEFANRHVRMAAITPRWEEAGLLTLQRLTSDDFPIWIRHGLERETERLNSLGDAIRSTDLDRLTNEELSLEFSKVTEALHAFIVFNNFVNTSDFYHHVLTRTIISCLREDMTPGSALSAESAYTILTTPETPVWIQEEEEDFLRILRQHQFDASLHVTNSNGVSLENWSPHEDLRIALEHHASKYFWLRYEQEGEILSASHFHAAFQQMLRERINAQLELDSIRERRAASKEQIDQLESTQSFGPKTVHLLRVARMLVYWKLHLREVKVRFYCSVDPLMAAIASRLTLDRYQVRHLTLEEVPSALLGAVTLDASAIRHRMEYCVFHFTRHGTRLFEGSVARTAFSIVHEESVTNDMTEVRGTCAFPGVAHGTVRQVLTVRDANAFPSDSVLVAYMTDVGVVSAMKRSSAIVTDVGGVTCHASIIGSSTKTGVIRIVLA